MSEEQVVAAAGVPDAGGQSADISYDRYLFPGWKTSLAAIFGGMAISFVLFGLFYPYWWFADQDLILAYQGLLFNAGLPQEYFDHTGYLYDLMIAGWYGLLHGLGLLPVHALGEGPPLTDVPAFDAAWQQLIVAARVLSLLLSAFFVWLYATLVRRLIGDWRLALLAGMALACSSALIMHMRMMRTELLSGGLAVSALFLLIFAARNMRRRWLRPVLLAVAALLVTLAIVTKVQAILLVMTLPVITLTFGQREPKESQSLPAWIAAAWMVAALSAAIPAANLFLAGMADFPGNVFPYRSLGVVADGTYQAAIALWVIAAMAVHCRVWRIGARDCAAGMAAVLLGVSLGLLSLTLRFNAENLIAVTHPVEQMFYFATWMHPSLENQTQIISGALFRTFAWGFFRALQAHDHEPVLLLQIFAVVGAVIAWRRGDRQLPVQVLTLVLVVLGLDAAFSVRWIKVEYFIYTDPLLILAAVLIASRFPEWQRWAWKRKASVFVVALCVLWGNHLPVRQFLFATHDPQAACRWLAGYIPRIEPFPFCAGLPPGYERP